MFSKIVESVLNEISAEDAYVKFYSNIPKDVFDELLSIYGGKFDFLFKFVLNNIKEAPTMMMIDYAKTFLNIYKNAENNIRMEFLKRLKNGEYDDLADAVNGIDEIKKNGVSTTKTMQKDGYVELYNDNKYLLTATLTYEASQHYYGKSKWCTASDRFGRYDGWYYFLSYIFRLDYVRSDNIYNNLGTSKYPLECVLVQFTDKEKNETYQAQVGKGNFYGQVCDFKDNSIDTDTFYNDIFPKNLRDLLESKLPELLAMEQKCFESEYKYQTEKNEYVEKKRTLIQERNKILREQLENELTIKTQQKADFVQQKFNSLINSNLIYNIDFIKQVITNTAYIKNTINNNLDYSDKKNIENLDELAKKQGYACVSKFRVMYKNIVELRIRPILGHILDINNDGIRPKLCDYFSLERNSIYIDNTLEGVCMYFLEIDNAEYFEKLFNEEINAENEKFENIEILNVLEVTKTDGGIVTIFNICNMFDETYKGENLDFTRFEGFKLVELFGKNKNTCSVKLCNFNNGSNVSFNIETLQGYSTISSILPISNLLFFMYYTDSNENGFTAVDINKMKVIGNFEGSRITYSDNCYILYDLNTLEMYILADKFYKTGVKVVNNDYSLKASMYDNFIVFNNDPSINLCADCKLFDCDSGKIIINHGKVESRFDNESFRYIHTVIDINTGEKIELPW